MEATQCAVEAMQCAVEATQCAVEATQCAEVKRCPVKVCDLQRRIMA